MADDPRDKRRAPMPPEGVQKQIARPIETSDSWDEYTPVQPVPKTPPHGAVVSKTPTHGVSIPRTISDSEMLQHVARRTGETKNVAIDTRAAATTTLDRVEILRKETREDINRVHEKVDAVIEVVGELRETVGKQEGQNELIIDMLDEAKAHRERTEHVKTTTEVARIQTDVSRQLTDEELRKASGLTALEIKKASGLDAIEARKERRKNFWALVWKGVAAVGVIWAFLSVTYLSQCRP